MTGGHERAAEINQELASIADELGLAFGLGSQRAMQKRPETGWTYKVRKRAPNVLLLGNVGVVQVRDMSTAAVAGILDEVGADALCVHMNPAMELVQPEGDRDFTAGLQTFQRLWAELEVPVIAIVDPDGIGPRVFFLKVPEGKTAKNRVHLDVSVPRDEQQQRAEQVRS